MSTVVCWFKRTLKQLEREQTDRWTDDYRKPLAHARRGLTTVTLAHARRGLTKRSVLSAQLKEQLKHKGMIYTKDQLDLSTIVGQGMSNTILVV